MSHPSSSTKYNHIYSAHHSNNASFKLNAPHTLLQDVPDTNADMIRLQAQNMSLVPSDMIWDKKYKTEEVL